MEQGSQQWLEARAGFATASGFADIIAVSKSNGKPLKAREDYAWKLATERLYGSPTEAFTSAPTEWGKKLEPFAREAYESETGNIVMLTGFVHYPEIAWCGSSPDGLVKANSGIEIKCPKDRRVHLQTWLRGMPEEHIPQVQGNMMVTGRETWDFISYDPRAPEDLRLYIQQVRRDDKYILALRAHIVEFLAEVQYLIEKIHANKSRYLRGEAGAADRDD